jgi:hypothetical protein
MQEVPQKKYGKYVQHNMMSQPRGHNLTTHYSEDLKCHTIFIFFLSIKFQRQNTVERETSLPLSFCPSGFSYDLTSVPTSHNSLHQDFLPIMDIHHMSTDVTVSLTANLKHLKKNLW